MNQKELSADKDLLEVTTQVPRRLVLNGLNDAPAEYAQETKVLEYTEANSNLLGFLNLKTTNTNKVSKSKQVELEKTANSQKFDLVSFDDQLEKAKQVAVLEDIEILNAFQPLTENNPGEISTDSQATPNEIITETTQTRALVDTQIASQLGIQKPVAGSSYIKHRSLLQAPLQVGNPILLELTALDTFAFDNFVINGQIDYEFPTNHPVEYFVKSLNSKQWTSLGATDIDQNKTFSFQNQTPLSDGKYLMLATTKALDGKSLYSKTFEIVIDKTKAQIAQPKLVVNPTQVGQALTLNLSQIEAGSKLTVNLQSVLYSSQAIVSSTQNQKEFSFASAANFEPGSTHTLTVYAQSIDDPDLKSEPIRMQIKFAGHNQKNIVWLLISLPLVTGLYLLRTRKGDQLTK